MYQEKDQEKGLKAPPVWRTHRVYGCAPHTSKSILYKYGLLSHKKWNLLSYKYGLSSHKNGLFNYKFCLLHYKYGLFMV